MRKKVFVANALGKNFANTSVFKYPLIKILILIFSERCLFVANALGKKIANMSVSQN